MYFKSVEQRSGIVYNLCTVLPPIPQFIETKAGACITTCTHWHLVLVRVLLVEVQEKRQTISSRGVSSTTCTTATNSSSTPH